MRILVYLHNLEVNGSNLVAYRYIKKISKMTDCRFGVSVKATGPMGKFFSSCGAEVLIEEPNSKSLSRFSFSIINSLIRQDALSLLSASKFPFVQYVHENWVAEDFIGGVNEKWNWYLQPWDVQKEALQCAKKLIFPAAYLAERYAEFQTAVIYNPVDTADLTGVSRSANTKSGGVDLINVATINPRKNQSLIVNVCSLNREIKSCRFFGDRAIRDHEIEYSRALRSATRENQHCTFEFNSVMYPLEFEVFPNTIFLLTSVEEVLPCTIQEMMSVGVPVVAPNRFGIPEVISDGVNGVLFDAYEEASVFSAIEVARQNAEDISARSVAYAAEHFDLEAQSIKLLDELR